MKLRIPRRQVAPISPFVLRSVAIAALLCVTAAATPLCSEAQQTIAQLTRTMEKRDGYLPLYWDAATGKLHLEITRPGEEFLYLTSLATGIGSNRLGLDRGMIGGEYLARFERVGSRIQLVLRNSRFRAEARPEPALQRSVEESFPTSIVASFDVLAEEDGRVLVDATPLFLRDAMDVTGRISSAGQGSYRLDPARSAIHLERTKAFPRNTEVEATLTFGTDAPGGELRQHAPDARALTLRQHHSFVALPPPGFSPREFDPRIGVFGISFWDYSKRFDEDPVTRYAVRHRLLKRDPAAAVSEAVAPIIYYLDPAVPEPYRTAFREGGMWYNQMFEAAGFRDAFRIEDMPADMDPLDARYHVIQWVHRTEAGSSIGPSFRDPRTGEIIKAAVRMDSHRSLVNYNQFMGAVAGGTAGAAGELDWVAALDANVSAEAFVMARRRQHSAHEIGHTLGLAHNFIAAADGRASVMDYPAPLVRLVDGRIDLSDAYRESGGAYDTLAIRWAYTQFAPGEEEAGLAAIVREAFDSGIRFITNPDADISNSHPDATWWTNGTDVLDELARVTAVRRALIESFDESAIGMGDPMWRLGERFSPAYLHHRYQLEAAIKTIGGMEYRYALRGDPLPPTRLIEAGRVQRALELLFSALEPAELLVPERVLQALAPRPFGHASDDRVFDSPAAPAFDQLAMARTIAAAVVGGVLEPRRVARVVAFSARDESLPTLESIVESLVERTWGRPVPGSRQEAALRRLVQRVVTDELMNLAGNAEATVESRAAAEWGLRRIARAAEAGRAATPQDEAHRVLVAADIERFLERRAEGGQRSTPIRQPPATPIGSRGET